MVNEVKKWNIEHQEKLGVQVLKRMAFWFIKFFFRFVTSVRFRARGRGCKWSFIRIRLSG